MVCKDENRGQGEPGTDGEVNSEETSQASSPKFFLFFIFFFFN